MLTPCYKHVKNIMAGNYGFCCRGKQLTRDNNPVPFIRISMEHFMTAIDERVRVWFIPQKFWAATRNMKPEQADSLFQRVNDLAERQETDALRQFDFIVVGKYTEKAGSC